LLQGDTTDLFSVSNGFQSRALTATAGATYKELGLEIKVAEVHSDYIVIFVKLGY
jgi:hypothetical protein